MSDTQTANPSGLTHVQATPQRGLLASAFQMAEHAYNRWRATVPHGTDPNSLVKPEFWAHCVAKGLRVHDIVEVIPESGEWLAILWCQDVGRAHARMKLLEIHMANDGAQLADVDGFKVEYRGAAKWTVMRKSDKSFLYRDLPTREAAEGKLAEYLKPQAA
jgi:hypothetical protein